MTAERPNSGGAGDVPVLRTASARHPFDDASLRAAFEREALAPFLPRQRWFAGKARTLTGARLLDWSGISDLELVTLAIVEVTFADGGLDRYFLPLATVPEVAPESERQRLAWIEGAQSGCLVDAVGSDDAWRHLLALMLDHRTVPMRAGTAAATRFDPAAGEPQRARVVRSAGEQSNSCAIFGDSYVVKLLRRLEAGLNPELEITRFLTGRRFAHFPPLVAAMEYEREGADPTSLAMVQRFVRNEGTAWDRAVGDAKRFLQADASGPGAAAVGWAGPAAVLGRRTAELHLALGDSATVPAFAPEPFDAPDATRLADAMRREAEQTLARLAERLDAIPEAAAPLARAVLDARPAIEARIEGVRAAPAGSKRTRVHGDYHLGQVLSTGEDFIIIDFEGEPARTLAERRAKQSPLKDVAGMLRSFSYAAVITLMPAAGGAPRHPAEAGRHDRERAARWEAAVSRAFLAAYRETMAPAALVPAQDEDFRRLLDALLLEKVLYELGYELGSRPHWVGIPLQGILQIVDSGRRTE